MFQIKRKTDELVENGSYKEWEVQLNCRHCPFQFTHSMDNKLMWLCARTRSLCEKEKCPFKVEGSD